MMLHTWMMWAVLASLTVCTLSTGGSLQPKNNSTDVANVEPNCMLQWLESLGFDAATIEKYAGVFGREEIDERVLKQITLDQLATLGVTTYGHRVLLQNSARAGSTACQNGGTCSHVAANNSFSCTCPKGFGGSYCENVRECGPTVCLNNGTCTKQNGSFTCQCPPGFTGQRCQNDNCDPQPCQNGGTCTPLPAGYNCSCPHGYEGSQCERVWLDPVEYNQLKQHISQATLELGLLKQLIAQRQRLVDQATLRMLDGMFAVEGPRFFKEWLDVNLSNVSQVRSFSIGPRQFLGAINTNTSSSHQYHGVIIYEIVEDSALVHIQTISEESPVSFKYFSIDDENKFIAVANYLPVHSNQELQSAPSRLYKWNGTLFNKVQDFSTEGAKDVDFIYIRNRGRFLVFSSHHNMHSYNTPSLVYIWLSPLTLFSLYQRLPTTAAQKVHLLTSDKGTYLTVASEYDRNGNEYTNSSVFRWNGTQFSLFQLIPTYRAHDLYPLQIGCHLFVVAANFFNNASSTVYRLDDGKFVEHASFETKGAVAAESFTIETEHFLTVANSDVNESSVIYKVTGPGLVPFQEIPMSSASYIHAFTLNSGCKALAVSNRAGKAKLYKWTRVSVLKNSCCE